MSTIVRIALLAARLVAVVLVMLIAFVVSAAVIRVGVEAPPEEAAQAGIALLVVSLLNSLILGYLILRSPWTGVKLIAAVFVVHFGIESFMTQIETLYFIRSVAMPVDMVFRVIGTGFLRALIFAPLAVLVLGKFAGPSSGKEFPHIRMPEWTTRFVFLAVLYAVVYFVFGYFVAWQWPEVRQYYTGSTAIEPFFTHIMNTFSGDPILPLFQVLRGGMWAALAFLIVRMMPGKAWETCLLVGLTLAVILASGVVFPNPFMPPLVRQGHLYELSSSMMTFGIIAGWVWTRPAVRSGIERSAQNLSQIGSEAK